MTEPERASDQATDDDFKMLAFVIIYCVGIFILGLAYVIGYWQA